MGDNNTTSISNRDQFGKEVAAYFELFKPLPDHSDKRELRPCDEVILHILEIVNDGANLARRARQIFEWRSPPADIKKGPGGGLEGTLELANRGRDLSLLILFKVRKLKENPHSDVQKHALDRLENVVKAQSLYWWEETLTYLTNLRLVDSHIILRSKLSCYPFKPESVCEKWTKSEEQWNSCRQKFAPFLHHFGFRTTDVTSSTRDVGESISIQGDIIIAVIGLTGCEKPAFIQNASGLPSWTTETDIKIVPMFEVDGRNIVLIDTPAFDNVTLGDTDVLAMTEKFVMERLQPKKTLDGFIYIHHSSDRRMGGVSLRNFDMFKKLCGDNTLKNITIVIYADDGPDAARATGGKDLLRDSPLFFKPAQNCGAVVVNLDRMTRDNALKILRRITEHHSTNHSLQNEYRAIGQSTAELESVHVAKVEDKKQLNKISADINEILKRRSPPVQTAGMAPQGSRRTARATNPMPRFKPRIELRGHKGGVMSVAFSHDGSRVVSGCRKGNIIVWGTDPWTDLKLKLRGHTDEVFSVAFSPDAHFIVSGSKDKSTCVWDAQGGKLLHEFSGMTWVHSVSYFPENPPRIVSGTHDGKCYLREVTHRVNDSTSSSPRVKEYEVAVFSVSVSPDEKQILSCLEDGTIRSWNVDSGTVSEYKGHNGGVTSAVFSPMGNIIVSGSKDNCVRVWETNSPQARLEHHQHTEGITAIAFLGDKYFVSGAKDKTIRVWGVAGEVSEPLLKHTDEVWSVACSRDGRWVVSGSKDKTIQVWGRIEE